MTYVFDIYRHHKGGWVVSIYYHPEYQESTLSPNGYLGCYLAETLKEILEFINEY